MSPSQSPPPASPLPEERAVLLRTLQVDLLATPELRERAQALLVARHYLGGVQAVDEQFQYAVSSYTAR